MSGNKLQRRDFLRKTSALAMTAVGFNLECYTPPAFRQRGLRSAPPEITASPMPLGKLGNLKVSRLIGGHNLLCFQAHDRDARSEPSLLQPQDADEKTLETFALYEKEGINTAFLHISDQMVKVAGRYGKERGGKLQWIAQLAINEKDQVRDLDAAMKLGIHAACIRGIEGDRYASSQMDILAKAVERAKSCRIPIGLGGHNIETMIAAEKAGLPVDFYFKTFNNAINSMSGEVPGETVEFFATVEKPWIAFRVIGPSRISARDGFRCAFADGADFVSSGMFDFQLAEDARAVRELFAGRAERMRPWRA